jgi:hypothetical protein
MPSKHMYRPVPELTLVYKAYKLALSQVPVTFLLISNPTMCISSLHVLHQVRADELTEGIPYDILELA